MCGRFAKSVRAASPRLGKNAGALSARYLRPFAATMADNGEAAAAPAAEPVAADEQAVEAASVDAEPSGVGGGGEDAEPSAQGEAAPELEAVADAGAEAASEEQPTQDTASPSAL